MYLISADHDLRLLKECERCFWLNYKSLVPLPVREGSSFEWASRAAIREYFDKYRGKLPPDMVGQLEGVLLPDMGLIGHWRDWRKGLRRNDAVMSSVLYGSMDDCLVQDSEFYIPVEFCFAQKEPDADELERSRTFVEGLTYLLAANGYKTLEIGYMVCYFPQNVVQHHSLMLKTKVMRFDTDLVRAGRLFYEGADILRKRTPPEAESGCPHCAWFEARAYLERGKK